MSLSDGIAAFCQDHLAELDRPDEFVQRLCRTFDLAPEDACLLTLRIINERQRNAQHPLIHLELVVTEACNLACDYCFCGPKRQAMMTPEVGQRAIDFLLGHSGSASTVYVTFFGGEPLLAMETIISVTHYGTAAAERRQDHPVVHDLQRHAAQSGDPGVLQRRAHQAAAQRRR